ncbi:hypothetical protein MRBLMI12_001051 [Microbacterium sp. LMI12-1-1.1]|uniref:hypothetical protein n=1 Tax=Microbacterium sp. LMI12-1-1.1 TaxID=3135225 RepID=UPI0034278ED7
MADLKPIDECPLDSSLAKARWCGRLLDNYECGRWDPTFGVVAVNRDVGRRRASAGSVRVTSANAL